MDESGWVNDRSHRMKLTIKAVPGARKNFVKEENGLLKVYVTAPAVDGRANEAVRDVLAEHFHVRSSKVVIVRGETVRQKTIEILP